MKSDDCKLIDDVAEEILLYLDAHPMAADTLQGIAYWWIDCLYDGCELRLVEAALESLADKKLIERRECGDGTFLYAGLRNSPGK
ncbi:MAG: hypothetical protein ACU826_12345 [Gammaproteobacteria bacterium]